MPANNPFSDAIAAVTQEYERLTDDADKKKTPPMQGRKEKAVAMPKTTRFMEEHRIAKPSDKKIRDFRQLYL